MPPLPFPPQIHAASCDCTKCRHPADRPGVGRGAGLALLSALIVIGLFHAWFA
ncbi:hypothetical protein [Sphingomonas nostoxanthinifaciens]|uniref:hypothetical protein n=1 Tax=Sphingomonas nostoxanthinifaciens TaxID=2872652 RepID=UPI001CC1D639|nr:hypothetical protein [Sphingomonas nostoxanthinifaciens]UAK24209.1 hypothetical protein K8P63_18060 [Sphingomonas nostoxanthinifaciens]